MMKNNFLTPVLLILMMLNSCAPKGSKIIAIDVLLTVPEDVYQHAIALNQSILKDNPDNFQLDDHHIPHITLLQAYVLESDMVNIEKTLESLYKTIEKDTLWASHLQYNKDKPSSFASIGIEEKNEPLRALHKEIIARLKPYILSDGNQEAYVQNPDGSPIDDFTIAYVPKFVSHYSYENFNPHISLGVAQIQVLDSLNAHVFREMKFRATSISVYQLGNFGTAQKLLWESK